MSVDLIVLSRWNIERVDKIHAGGGFLGRVVYHVRSRVVL
jgi:hypothetical protein